ncbi:MAG: hypothetical protein WCO04_04360, partial [Pseudomonadota bacterium]
MSESTGNADERLVVMLEARIAEFEKRMIQAEKSGTRTYQKIQSESRKMASRMETDAMFGSKALNSALGNVSSKIGGFAMSFAGGIAGGLIASAFGDITSNIRGVIGDIGDLNDAANRLGLSTDTLQGLEHGFKLQGIATDEARGALDKFVDGIGQAAQGTGTLKDTLDKNGISIRNQNGELKNTGDLLKVYADLVNAAPDAASKMALVTDAFGRGGKAMVGALEGGAPAIDAMIKAAKDGGYVLDSSLVAKGAALDDKFDMLSGKIKVMFETALVESADFFSRMISDAGNAADYIASLHLLGEAHPGPVVDVSATPELDALTAAARRTTDALAGVVQTLMDLENTQPAAVIVSDLSDKIEQLTLDLQNGKISQGQFQKGLFDATTEAENFISVIAQVSGIDLSDALSQIDGLRNGVRGLAASAQEAMAAVGELPGMLGRASGVKRPNLGGRAITGAPMDTWAESHPATGGGGGGGGGGSKGSAALDTLLQDLQSQREALDAWYTESQTLLGTATDAQLAALGGRHAALERLERQHQQKMVGLGSQGNSTQLDNAGTFFGALATITQAG